MHIYVVYHISYENINIKQFLFVLTYICILTAAEQQLQSTYRFSQ